MTAYSDAVVWWLPPAFPSEAFVTLALEDSRVRPDGSVQPPATYVPPPPTGYRWDPKRQLWVLTSFAVPEHEMFTLQLIPKAKFLSKAWREHRLMGNGCVRPKKYPTYDRETGRWSTEEPVPRGFVWDAIKAVWKPRLIFLEAAAATYPAVSSSWPPWMSYPPVYPPPAAGYHSSPTRGPPQAVPYGPPLTYPSVPPAAVPPVPPAAVPYVPPAAPNVPPAAAAPQLLAGTTPREGSTAPHEATDVASGIEPSPVKADQPLVAGAIAASKAADVSVVKDNSLVTASAHVASEAIPASMIGDTVDPIAASTSVHVGEAGASMDSAVKANSQVPPVDASAHVASIAASDVVHAQGASADDDKPCLVSESTFDNKKRPFDESNQRPCEQPEELRWNKSARRVDAMESSASDRGLEERANTSFEFRT